MQIEKLSLENWAVAVQRNGFCSPTFQVEFIKIVKRSYQIESVQYIIYNHEKPVLSSVLYVKSKNIVHPSQYFYTAIWESCKSKLILQKAYLLLIEELTSNFRNIRLRLSPEITDIRPFSVNGFSTSVNYTYYKNLEEVNLDSKLLARKKKSEVLGLEFNWDLNNNIVEQNIAALKPLGYKSAVIKPLQQMISLLYQYEFLIGVAAEIDGTMLGSALIMVDKENRVAMNLLITSKKENYNTGLHSALYINIFDKLRTDGYLINDLYGANILGIGNFKANFAGELKPHYTVNYNYLKNKCKVILSKFSRQKIVWL